ncbi:MAG: DUF3467 domain-containing protein [Candidatus Electryonea clarkiae]|nr:DUF3467 domain-containing protein [Candidatus Electryonea clarkiae]MDP8286578.1 DUF3467 domain-containing protein [Candidatus Electryonea clarkiae]
MSDSKQPMQQPQQRIQIQLDPEVVDGHYANLVLINHSPAEFILDFARVVPGSQKAKVQTRTILSPIHARNLLTALETNIKKYEDNFGEIKMHGKEQNDKSFGFQS